MADKKRYTVRIGKKIGIFNDRNTVQPLVSGVNGSKYKSFKNIEEAQIAFKKGRETYYQKTEKKPSSSLAFIKKSIAVDAACSSSTKIMEYQGIDLTSSKQIFHFKSQGGTNNIGEFLAIVHALSYLQKEGKTDFTIYSDSNIAINRVYQGKCKTNLSPSGKNQDLFTIIIRAENRLKNNPIIPQILKWETQERGEIPADFGRK